MESPEPFEDRIAEISLDLAEEDDIEEDDFEEDTNFCSGKIPFNIKCEKIALTISLHNFTKFHIQYQLREFALIISLHNLTKIRINNFVTQLDEIPY